MTGPIFERFTREDVRLLIEEYPLAWVQARTADPLDASLLPLLGVFDGEGRLDHLVGHLARRNPLCAAWRTDSRATILFRGPEGYVSPHHAERRDWGPTWNYAQLVVACEIEMDDALTEPALDSLIDGMERDRVTPWRKEELGERLSGMVGQIVGFRARVMGMRGRFKLGQDERPETFAAIMRNHPDDRLRAWMGRFDR